MIPGQFDYVRPARPGRGAADPQGPRRGGEAAVRRLQPDPAHQAPPGAAGPARRPADITGLDGIIETDDDLRIGARATHRQIHENPIVVDHYPGLIDLAGHDRRPAGAQLGHDRRLGRPRRSGQRLAGASCSRSTPRSSAAARPASACIAARDFFLDTFTTAIEPTEVLTEIRLIRRPRRSGGAYTKLERKVGDFATVRRRPRSSGSTQRGHDRARRDRPDRRRRDPVRRHGRARRSSSATRRRTSCSARPVPPPVPSPARPPTSADRSTTSARWPREMTVRSLRTAVARALAYV